MDETPVGARWQVGLKGHPFDLEVLAAFKLPEGVRRLEEGGLTFLLFERPAETPPSEILDSAKRLVTIFNGAAFVFGVDSERIEADGVTRLEHDGRRSIFVVLTGAAAGRARASATLTVTNADGSERPPPEAPGARALLVAISNPVVEKVFRILGSSDRSFRDLYVVLEAIAEDLGGLRDLFAQKWVSEDEIRRLRHTANSVAVLGDEARHGAEQTQPPTDPMSLKEGRKLVEKIAALWIASKRP
jgi:hypothetical protein